MALLTNFNLFGGLLASESVKVLNKKAVKLAYKSYKLTAYPI